MLVLKIVAVLLGYAIAFGVALLDYRQPFSETHKKIHKRLVLGVLLATPILAVATVILAVHDHLSAEADRRQASEDRATLQRMEATLGRVAEAVEAGSIDEIEDRIADLKNMTTEQGAKLKLTEETLDAMQRAAAPRALSRRAREILRKELSAAPAAIELFVLIGNSEAVNYGDQLKKVFEEAGWTVTVHRAMFNPVLVGISLQLRVPASVHSIPMSHPFVTVKNALEVAEVPFKSERYAEQREIDVRLSIGAKR